MDTNIIIKQAIEAIKQGNKSNARALLENVIKNEPNNEEAWFLLAHVAQTQEQARSYLGRVININPNNERAKQQLEKLNATPLNKQTAPQPVKAKESKAVLYTLLGGIIILLLVVILLLAGIWLKSDNTPSNISVIAPTTVPSNANATSIPKWEYKEIEVVCVFGYSKCQVDDDYSREYTNRTAVLNEFAKQGWEVIYSVSESQSVYSILYGLRRPIIGK